MHVTHSEDTLEIAQAAWRILNASGGLVDRSEIARRYRLSKTRVHGLTQQRHFPEPVGTIGRTPVWLAAEVQRYRSQPPPVGRPRTRGEQPGGAPETGRRPTPRA